MSGQAPRHADPAFVPSLRLLIEDQQYTLSDMFGVSRERVRQWCARYSIHYPANGKARGLACERMWDDTAHVSRPVARRVLYGKHLTRERAKAAVEEQRCRAQRARNKRTARLMRRELAEETARALKASLGRQPTWRELAEQLGLPPERQRAVYVLHYWGCYASLKGGCTAFRKAVGWDLYPPRGLRRKHGALGG